MSPNGGKTSLLLLATCLSLTSEPQHVHGQMSYIGLALEAYNPCALSDGILSMSREIGRKPSEENYWEGSIHLGLFKNLPEARIELVLTDLAVITVDPEEARVYADGTTFRITLFAIPNYFKFTVKAGKGKPFPNLVSLKINEQPVCENPTRWSPTFLGEVDTAISTPLKSDSTTWCGRRQVRHTELITNGRATKPGDWPWHAALYTYSLSKNQQAYSCGATLVSTTAVVTAAHCVTKRGQVISSDLLLVVLGKYNLKGTDPGSQEREISKVIVGSEFNAKTLKNDIAILRLATEVVFTEYVQPICLWPADDTLKDKIYGENATVVGWGQDENDTLSEQLTAGSMLVVSDTDCLLSYASFFENFVHEKSFCAGRRNGTSACNGDSGGGLMIPRVQADGEDTYYLRGIVSVSVSRVDRAACDPKHFVVFTDAAKYLDFIVNNKDGVSMLRTAIEENNPINEINGNDVMKNKETISTIDNNESSVFPGILKTDIVSDSLNNPNQPNDSQAPKNDQTITDMVSNKKAPVARLGGLLGRKRRNIVFLE